MKLSRYYRTLGGVPRWSIVRLTQPQNVLEHTALVAMYAHDIAKILGYEGDMGELLRQCLHHDLPEVETGDLPSPIKSRISNKATIAKYEDEILSRRFDISDESVDANMHEILKVADILEGVLKLSEELAVGNRAVLAVLCSMTSMLFERIDKLEFAEDKRLSLKHNVVQAIKDEMSGYDGIRSELEGQGFEFWRSILDED